MDNKEQEINLADIFYLLLSKLHIIILLAVIGGCAGFGIAKFVLAEKFTSSISIYVNNSSRNTLPEDGKLASQDIYASQALAGTYIVILEDDTVYEQVSKLLIEDYEISDLEKVFTITQNDKGESVITPGQIKQFVSINSVNETEVISISATTANPQLSADICTYIANVAPDLLTRVTKAGSVETIGTAKVPSSPSSPNVKKNAAIGFALGFVLAVAVIIISDLIDNRIKFTDDFKKRFEDIPVLSEIPEVGETDKEAYRYEYR